MVRSILVGVTRACVLAKRWRRRNNRELVRGLLVLNHFLGALCGGGACGLFQFCKGLHLRLRILWAAYCAVSLGKQEVVACFTWIGFHRNFKIRYRFRVSGERHQCLGAVYPRVDQAGA